MLANGIVTPSMFMDDLLETLNVIPCFDSADAVVLC